MRAMRNIIIRDIFGIRKKPGFRASVADGGHMGAMDMSSNRHRPGVGQRCRFRHKHAVAIRWSGRVSPMKRRIDIKEMLQIIAVCCLPGRLSSKPY